jgi:hypothetical protein
VDEHKQRRIKRGALILKGLAEAADLGADERDEVEWCLAWIVVSLARDEIENGGRLTVETEGTNEQR